MAHSITIRIRNYEKFKGRSDVKLNSWFRCDNRLLEDPDFYDFSHEELLVWIQILALSSQKNSAVITLNLKHLERVCRLRPEAVHSAIAKLSAQLEPIEDDLCSEQNKAPEELHDTSTVRARNVDGTRTLRARNADVTDTCATEQDRTVHDIQERERAPTDHALAGAEPGRCGLKGEWTLDAVKLSVPVFLREDWRRKYPDESWVDEELRRCFEHFTLVPGETPRSAGKWHQKLNAWLKRGWEDRQKKPAQKPASNDWAYIFGQKGGA